MTPEIHLALFSRLQTLERKAKRYARLNAVLGLTLVVVFLLGARSEDPSILKTSGLQVIDRNGSVRTEIGFDENNDPVLRMLDTDGRPRATLELWSSGEPHFELKHANGTAQLVLQLANGDLPWLDLYDELGTQVVGLGLNSYNAPSLEMSDSAEQRHMDLRFDANGYFGAAFYSPDYDDRLRVGITTDGVPAVELFGPTEEPMASFGITTDNSQSFLTLQNATGDHLFSIPQEVRSLSGGTSN